MSVCDMEDIRPLHLVTPCLFSPVLSRIAGFSVYMKLENLQLPGSFKIRGIGHLCQKYQRAGCKRLVCASGGNAGLATAYAGSRLGIPVTIVLPKSTPSFVADMLRDEGATVEVHGNVWDDSNQYGLEMCQKDKAIKYVHPFDIPDIWEGHTSLITETADQIPRRPDVVITTVGGGGLLIGIVKGMQKQGWNDIPVVAMETIGADCLNQTLKKGELVTLPTISSVAKCLGALTPATTAVDITKTHNILSEVVPDREAVSACLRFADDHRMLVEPACGAGLAALYSGVISRLQEDGKLGEVKTALVIVCGGSGVSLEQLQKWKVEVGL